MRSRYSAYVLKFVDYLLATHHPEKRPRTPDPIWQSAYAMEFEKLVVLRSVQGGPGDKIGKVEFKVYFRQNGELHMMQELSRFRRYQGRWVYWDGELTNSDAWKL